MRLLCAVFVSTMILTASEPQAKATKPGEIPAGAVEREPGRFYFTDAQGKKWIFSKTPFGTARLEDKPPAADAPKPIDPMASVKISVDGDMVRFERPGPLGMYRWQKKQADLDEQEKAAFAKFREQSSKPSPQQEK